MAEMSNDELALELAEYEQGLVTIDGEAVTENDIRENMLRNIYWRSKDLTLTNIMNMKDSHLRNTVLMLSGFGYQRYICSDKMRLLWLMAFKMEWDRRQVAGIKVL